MIKEATTQEDSSIEKASSVQIGFILNTGIMTVFIAVMLVTLAGGFGEDLSTEQELEEVADEIEANIVEADTIVQTGGNLEAAYFSPPDSGVDYTGRVYEDGSGDVRMQLTAPDGTQIGEGGAGARDLHLDNMTVTDMCTPVDEEFTQQTVNLFIEGGSCIDIEAENAVAQEVS